jgi:hypothetical protein
MAIYCEVTDGLQLFLDSSKSTSYPGSGTTWYDLSSNEYTATLINSVSYNSGNKGYLSFDGSDYIDVNQSLESESFSVGALFRTSSPGVKMILSKETPSGYPWNYRIWLNEGQINADIAQGATQSSLSSPLTTYNDGNWYYIMFTRDDDTWKLYINGVEINSKSDNFTGSITNSQELWIGRSAFTGQSITGSYQYTGDISAVMIYNRVLSQSEIAQNYDCLLNRFLNFNIGSTVISGIKLGSTHINKCYIGNSRVW